MPKICFLGKIALDFAFLQKKRERRLDISERNNIYLINAVCKIYRSFIG